MKVISRTGIANLHLLPNLNPVGIRSTGLYSDKQKLSAKQDKPYWAADVEKAEITTSV